jgi:hypothetical protein
MDKFDKITVSTASSDLSTKIPKKSKLNPEYDKNSIFDNEKQDLTKGFVQGIELFTDNKTKKNEKVYFDIQTDLCYPQGNRSISGELFSTVQLLSQKDCQGILINTDKEKIPVVCTERQKELVVHSYTYKPDNNGTCYYLPYISEQLRYDVSTHNTLFSGKPETINSLKAGVGFPDKNNNNYPGLGYVTIKFKDLKDGTLVFTKGLTGCSILILQHKEHGDITFVHDANSKAVKRYLKNEELSFRENFLIIDYIDSNATYANLDREGTINTGWEECDRIRNTLLIKEPTTIQPGLIVSEQYSTLESIAFFIYNKEERKFSLKIETVFSVLRVEQKKSSSFLFGGWSDPVKTTAVAKSCTAKTKDIPINDNNHDQILKELLA